MEEACHCEGDVWILGPTSSPLVRHQGSFPAATFPLQFVVIHCTNIAGMDDPAGCSFGDLLAGAYPGNLSLRPLAAPINVTLHSSTPERNNTITMSRESEYPDFSDGDVRIIITGSRQYTLHSSILKSSSPVMRQLLDDDSTAKLTHKAIKRGMRITNRLHMVENDGDEGGVDYVLMPVKLNEEGKPVTQLPVGLDLENGRVVSPTVLVRHRYNIQIATGALTAVSYTHLTLPTKRIV